MVNADPVPKEERPLLRGVTVRISPYIEVAEDGGKFKGFIPDLMDLISEKVGFDYELYLSPDGRYGNPSRDGDNVTGMIGEVYNKKADFAAADLTITELRENYITFTEPFMINQLAALIKRNVAKDMQTLEELADYNEHAPPNEAIIIIGTLKSGATRYFLKKSDDPIAKKLNQLIELQQFQHGETLTKTITEGVERVEKDDKYAFIMESPSAEHEIARNCQLTMLIDKRNLFPRKYAIALPKDSQYIDHFNNAIKQLMNDGKIMELRKKYWPNNCSKSDEKNDDKKDQKPNSGA